MCQHAADYADMAANPKDSMTIFTQRGLAGGPRAEVKHAKEGFDGALPLEGAVCGAGSVEAHQPAAVVDGGGVSDANVGAPAVATPAAPAVAKGEKKELGKL